MVLNVIDMNQLSMNHTLDPTVLILECMTDVGFIICLAFYTNDLLHVVPYQPVAVLEK